MQKDTAGVPFIKKLELHKPFHSLPNFELMNLGLIFEEVSFSPSLSLSICCNVFIKLSSLWCTSTLSQSKEQDVLKHHFGSWTSGESCMNLLLKTNVSLHWSLSATTHLFHRQGSWPSIDLTSMELKAIYSASVFTFCTKDSCQPWQQLQTLPSFHFIHTSSNPTTGTPINGVQTTRHRRK